VTVFSPLRKFSRCDLQLKHKPASFLSKIFFPQSNSAFTLIELLVTIAIIFLLLGVLMPALSLVRAKSQMLFCRSNLRQLVLGNISYASDHQGSYAAGSFDIFTENKHRWYGIRNSIEEPFDTRRGAFEGYIGKKKIRCPVGVDYLELEPIDPEYDSGSGGYGYNMVYIGSRIWSDGYDERSCRITAKDTQIRNPAKTLMFADTAMAKFTSLIEYSFAEPRFFLMHGRPNPGWDPVPSIHFRHFNEANIGWADTHVDSGKMGPYDGVNEYGNKPSEMNLGWFEPLDNSLFDLE